MKEIIAAFQSAMKKAGLYTDVIEADGKLHRFKAPEDNKANSWYVLFDGEVAAGAFGCWKRDIKKKWCFEELKHLTNERKANVSKCFSKIKAELYNSQEDKFLKTSIKAEKIWQSGFKDVDDHPYLLRKKITAYNCRSINNNLILPLVDADDKIWSLQYINAEGNKWFLKDGKKKGLFHIIGNEDSDIIYICEGYATACTILESTSQCVIIAFDANNLVSASKAIKNKYQNKTIIIAADDDQFTSANPGITKAKDAANLINAKVIAPTFSSLETKPTDFNDLYLLEGIDKVREQLNPKIITNQSPDCPSGFIVNKEGVFFAPMDEDGECKAKLKICSRLDIVARTRDEQGLSHGRLLEFNDPDGNVHKWALPMELLAGDGLEFRRTLLSRGLELSSSRKAREQLTNYILSSRPKRVALCVERTGWHDDIYILPKETFGKSNEEVIFQNTYLDNYFQQRGDLTQWQDNISRYCENNSRLLFALSTSFASAILHLLGEESGGFHFMGASSIGKTTLLQIAASVWGGSERLLRWRATNNGLEAIASMHNDSLLCLDEMGQVDEREVGEIAYMLANGSGKGRCQRDGTIRKKSTWRLIFLSTGEIGLSDHIQQGGKKIKAGQEVRLIDIPADANNGLGIFEDTHSFNYAMELAKHLSDASKNVYGTAIRTFLNKLVLDSNFVISFSNTKRNEFIKMYVPSNADGQVQRVARRFALVAAAGELATTFNITGWQENSAFCAAGRCFRDWIGLRGGLGAKEPQIALSHVRHFFELHGESRFTPWFSDENQAKTINRAGFRRKGEFFVFPEVFKQDICVGLNPKYVAQLCISKGWLLPDSLGKPVTCHRMPDTGNVRRVYHFCEKVIDDVQEPSFD